MSDIELQKNTITNGILDDVLRLVRERRVEFLRQGIAIAGKAEIGVELNLLRTTIDSIISQHPELPITHYRGIDTFTSHFKQLLENNTIPQLIIFTNEAFRQLSKDDDCKLFQATGVLKVMWSNLPVDPKLIESLDNSTEETDPT